MPVSDETYKRVEMEDDETWELVCGRLRKKPLMTTEHNQVQRTLQSLLATQLDRRQYTVGADVGRVRISTGTYYVPDLVVIPMALVNRLREQPGTFEVYDDPMPLVVEVWSPSTGDHDIDDKVCEYQLRGDLEIWRIHPYERTLIAWRRQPDGSYTETHYTSGVVRPAALPNVAIDIATLFE